jgi:hypothetical protein
MSVALALAGAGILAGCSSVIDHIPPTVGGLPEGVPERPAGPTSFPAVHDIPPRRTETTLSEEEKKRLREDLASTRERAKAAPAEPPK